MALVRAHFAEAARVLRPGCELLILNFAYRNDPAKDRREVARMATTHGFEVLVNGSTPFTLWNGAAFRMRKPLDSGI
jgi:hypothetical protein